MKVSVLSNGHLELHISDPSGPVQEAALNVLAAAVTSGRSVKVETREGAIAIVLEEAGA